VLPGLRPGEIAEEGSQPTTQAGSRRNYFIYMTGSSRIYPAEMWIHGEPYSVLVEPVSTPVEYRSSQSENVQPIVLVPATSEKVIRLTPAPAIEAKLTATGRKLSTDNALVVVYKANGKFHYQVLAELKQLPTAAMQ
ncbi:MAG TPA: hypothetical protein VFZ78_13190, partial [Flavisolibacter sp.]